jgi:hypothetical protein
MDGRDRPTLYRDTEHDGDDAGGRGGEESCASRR